MGLSFETISSVGSNGAIIHYKPEPETARQLDLNQVYLCDSGAQYKDGTIDTTRTMFFGQPSDYLRDCYTRVLLGVLELETVKWPKVNRISGADVDILARKWLW
mmetsp:Transcript_12472/g.1867  ORF Transcript_12472/g.1867 Transcript_12472/m.1867 type:complete len:104 (+) Transcript_12472:1074-1385(+)